MPADVLTSSRSVLLRLVSNTTNKRAQDNPRSILALFLFFAVERKYRMSSVNNESAILVSIAERSSDVDECMRSLDD